MQRDSKYVSAKFLEKASLYSIPQTLSTKKWTILSKFVLDLKKNIAKF